MKRIKAHHIFHNDRDLAKKFGERFVVSLHSLVDAYRKRNCRLPLGCLKVASVAFLFYGAAVDGDSRLLDEFETMSDDLGEIVMDGECLRLSEEDSTRELMWDIAALMLETNSELPDVCQQAFDIVGRHQWMAYTIISADEPMGAGNVVVEAKTLDASVPALSEAQIDDMCRYAEMSGDPDVVRSMDGYITSNFMKRYHSKEYSRIEQMHARHAERMRPSGINFNAPFYNNAGTVSGNVYNKPSNNYTVNGYTTTTTDHF